MITEFFTFFFSFFLPAIIVYNIIKSFKIINDAEKVIIYAPVTVTIELIDGVMYSYAQNNFLCQGSTLEEIAQKMQSYHNIKLALILFGDNVFVFKNGEIVS